MDPFLVFAGHKVLQPRSGTLARCDGFLLQELAIAEEQQVESREVPRIHHLKFCGNAEGCLSRHDWWGLDFAQIKRAHSLVAAETDADERHSRISQGRQSTRVVRALIGDAVCQRDYRQRWLDFSAQGLSDGASQVRPFSARQSGGNFFSVGHLRALIEEHCLHGQAGRFEGRQ